ncbi:alpha-crystallin B chain-like [Anoplophora glabripennis]|uniref:alpha-crystallin B chain-like n=1 Tax=Anoplophora glabripennis TaxID=217634 RepID=UPI000873A833|nr:alpha-crystallin B chain-like [Anoplophora glabripennis]
MSLLPLVFRDVLRPLRKLENQMRLTEELFHPTLYCVKRPRHILDFDENLLKGDAVIQDKEKFQLKLDVQDFKPEEIRVKTVDGNAVEIEAKHDEKYDEGFISKQLIKRFVLPKGHDLKSVVSSLSTDGVLTITARRRVEDLEEKSIPVIHEGTEKNRQ